MRPLGARHAWLSITPEPEQELPRAIAALRCGRPPPGELVERERARAERIVLHGTRGAWLAYLGEASRLAREREDVDGARAVIEDVIENHDNLALGLARRTRSRRHNGGSR